MALITCPECKNQVSDKAAACPQCGAPVANAGTAQATGSPVVTTESTSKSLKAHQAMAMVMIILGVAIACTNAQAEGSHATSGAAIAFVGLIWWLVARIRAWWHHG